MMCDFLSVVDPLSGSFATLLRFLSRLLTVGRSRSRVLGQVDNPDQVVGGGSELKDPTRHLQSAVSGLTQQRNRLEPAKDFFPSFALTLTNFITRVAGGAGIDGAPP